MLPPERRLGPLLALIESQRYFTLHAGRQTGKTTSARWLVKHYNAGDRFCAIWVDVQDARELSDPARAFELGEAMVSLLTQIRQGYIGREELPFPASIVLVGQRQVRDYALREEDRKALAWLGTTSPFNITAEATTLGPFSEAEVGELVQQHTAVTGQRFSPEAVAKIWALGCGHPWLTNALADQIVRRDVMDRSIEITAEHVEAAKETIILERRTHIDSLVARLREDRVQRVIAPMLTGEASAQAGANGSVDPRAPVARLPLVMSDRDHHELGAIDEVEHAIRKAAECRAAKRRIIDPRGSAERELAQEPQTREPSSRSA
jgi:hypothetical protein